MDFAFILDPLPLLKAYKDSSVAMMRSLAARSHRIYALTPADLYWHAGATRARVAALTLHADAHDWYTATATEERALADFAAVVMRKDPPFDMEYVYSTYLLETAEAQGARVFNRPRAIRDNNEKMAIAKFGEFVAPTLVTRDAERIGAFIDQHKDVIVKPLDGMGGTSVFRVRVDDPNRNVILEIVGQCGARTVMAQRYIPAIVDGDKRVLLIAGEAVPFALARIPKPGETRGNLAAGGRGVARPLTPRDRAYETLTQTVMGNDQDADHLGLVGVAAGVDESVAIHVSTCFSERIRGAAHRRTSRRRRIPTAPRSRRSRSGSSR